MNSAGKYNCCCHLSPFGSAFDSVFFAVFLTYGNGFTVLETSNCVKLKIESLSPLQRPIVVFDTSLTCCLQYWICRNEFDKFCLFSGIFHLGLGYYSSNGLCQTSPFVEDFDTQTVLKKSICHCQTGFRSFFGLHKRLQSCD